MPDEEDVRQMFARIAPRYDRANHLLSMGVDHLWRRAAVRYAGIDARASVLDVCAGTGDLSLAFARAGARVTGSDFCVEMVELAAANGIITNPAISWEKRFDASLETYSCKRQVPTMRVELAMSVIGKTANKRSPLTSHD